MDNYDWEVKIVDVGYKIGLDIFLFFKDFNGIHLLHGDVVELLPKDGTAAKPTLSLSPSALQAFADALDKMGIKPQKGFIEGKLAATEKHLEDMRRLVFDDKEIIIDGVANKIEIENE